MASIATLTALLVAIGTGSTATGAEDYAFFHENVMGTSLELRIRAETPQAAAWAENRILTEIDRLSAIISSYDPASEFSRWRAAPRQPTEVSPELFALLQASDHWRETSNGAFDPRIQVLSDLWTRTAKASRPPTSAEIAKALRQLRQPAWSLDAAAGTAELRSDCPLTLNAIAKGAIVERAANIAFERGRGIRGLLLNVGGDLCVRGELIRRLGIASPFGDSETTDPICQVEVQDRAVATSGNYQRGWKIKERWYSHILDPRTGMPVERVVAATVIAEKGADADALATICNVLPVADSLRLVSALPGAECLLIESDGRQTRSPGWHRYERPLAPLLALADEPKSERSAPAKSESKTAAEKPAPAKAWEKDFELAVDFEIASPEAQGRRYRRPYVAVWVEDKAGKPVRTLILWVSLGGAGPEKWLPDLRRWHRGDVERRQDPNEKDFVYTIARSTRPAGKYKVVWDGKDNHGKQLPGGEYTLHIEAAREHGTYQSIRKPLNLASKPFAEELKGNVEIKSASVEYRRKSPAK
jgi:thiamine biosynthesis lipoprotein ApbE